MRLNYWTQCTYIRCEALTKAPKAIRQRTSPIWKWGERYETQLDLARFALDILAVPPMLDECERLFSSAKILLEDRCSRWKMDIVEVNEVLRHSYGPLRKDIFDDEGVGEVEGEP